MECVKHVRAAEQQLLHRHHHERIVGAAAGLSRWNYAGPRVHPTRLPIEAAVSDLLQPDQASEALSNARCHWAPLISQMAELDPRVRARVAGFAPETRLLLDAALPDTTRDPGSFLNAWVMWSPLLCRLFPRLPV